MSRHRNIKNIDIDYEKDDYSDYSRSAEENFCISPSVAEFIYSRDQSGGRIALGDHFIIPEEDGRQEQDVDEISRRLEQFQTTAPVETVFKETMVYSPACIPQPSLRYLESPMPECSTANVEQEKQIDPIAEPIVEKPARQSVAKRHWTVAKGSKPVLNLVVIGHVDAGKSTLMGHLLFQLGNVDQKVMHRFKQESQKIGKSSFAYAWILDESSEERSRGITMDVAQTRFETPKFSVNLLDAPGHKDFIPNMIVGTSQADVALLVVNATSGEFESGFDLGGQTREHTLLARSLGVQQIVIAVNKMDTVEWSQQRFVDIQERVQAFLKQIGFKETSIFVPCSGLMGVGLRSAPDAGSPLSKWYKGPCLLQAFDLLDQPKRALDGSLRMIVRDVYKAPRGSGFYASGKVASGGVAVGDRVVIMPSATVGSIKAVQNSDDQEVAFSCAGEQCSVLLTGVDMNTVFPGDIVCHVDSPISVCSKMTVKIVTFAGDMPLIKGMQVVVHVNGAQQPGYIGKIVAEINRTTGREVKSRPRCLPCNSGGIVVVRTEKPMCVERVDVSKELSRVTLRRLGKTIAAGLVTQLS